MAKSLDRNLPATEFVPERDAERLVRWARSWNPILILGEVGTGKTNLAWHIHQLSLRTGRFISQSLGSATDSLVLVQMFGSVLGGYTDARNTAGTVEEADKGTLFLDEIGIISPPVYRGLLPLLNEPPHVRISRSGETRERQLNVRFIAATNANLAAMVRAGSFPADLLSRFGYLIIRLAPLRARRNEIVPLFSSMLEREITVTGRPPFSISPRLRKLLRAAPLPGNLRDLRQLARFLVTDLADDRTLAEPADLPPGFLPFDVGKVPSDLAKEELAMRAIAERGGNLSGAARKLGMSRSGMYRLLDSSFRDALPT